MAKKKKNMKAKQQNMDGNGSVTKAGPASKSVGNKLNYGRRNMSMTRTPGQRAAYPHLLEAATSTMHLATTSGLSPSWMATYANLVNSPALPSWKQFAEYNTALDEASRERLAMKMAVERPLAPRTRGRVEFLARNGQNALIAETTGLDALLAQEEWHREFSAEIGRYVKFKMFEKDINKIYQEQRLHGEYGIGDAYTKGNGTPFTPYERLYNTLFDKYLAPVDYRNELNIPSHLRGIADLGDLVNAALSLITPVSIGLESNTWTLPSGINLHGNGFMEGYNSIDFGIMQDGDGNIRYHIQMPASANVTGHDEAKSTAQSTSVPSASIYHKDGGASPVDADLTGAFSTITLSPASWTTFINGSETADDLFLQGVNLRELPGSAVKFVASTAITGGLKVRSVPLNGLESSWEETFSAFPSPSDFRGVENLQRSWFEGLQKLWTADPITILSWCRAVSQSLTPEYLATGVSRLQSFNDEQCVSTLTSAKLADLINLGSDFKMRFNPIKKIEANNGPFGRNADGEAFDDAWREINWYSPEYIGGSTYAFQVERLGRLFSSHKFETGFGFGSVNLSEVIALLNPRWAEQLFTLSNKSSLDKTERFVAVPGQRVGVAQGYLSEGGEFAMEHMLMMLQRIYGTFSCVTSAPLADIDYSAGGSVIRSTSVTYGTSLVQVASMHHAMKQTDLAPSGLEDDDVTLSDGTTIDLGWIERNLDEFKFTIDDREEGNGTYTYKLSDDKITVSNVTAVGAAVFADHPFIDIHNLKWTNDAGTAQSCVVAGWEVISTDESTKTGEAMMTLFHDTVAGPQRMIIRMRVNFKLLNTLALTSDSTKDEVDEVVVENTKRQPSVIVSPPTTEEWQNAASNSTSFDLTTVQIDLEDAIDNQYGYDAAKWAAAFGVGFKEAQLTIVNATVNTSSDWKVRIGLDVPSKTFGGSWPRAYIPISAWHNAPRVTADSSHILTAVNNGVQTRQPTATDIARGVLWKYFSFGQMGGTIVTFSDLWEIGNYHIGYLGSTDAWYPGTYYLPQNEDLVYNQRTREFDAAVLDLSAMRFYPLALNPEFGMYPYWGVPVGFMRDLIQQHTPDIVEYHYQSGNPFLIPNLAFMRVEKAVFDPPAYARSFSDLVTMVGNGMTELTADDLRRAQDIQVRRGQSAVN